MNFCGVLPGNFPTNQGHQLAAFCKPSLLKFTTMSFWIIVSDNTLLVVSDSLDRKHFLKHPNKWLLPEQILQNAVYCCPKWEVKDNSPTVITNMCFPSTLHSSSLENTWPFTFKVMLVSVFKGNLNHGYFVDLERVNI